MGMGFVCVCVCVLACELLELNQCKFVCECACDRQTAQSSLGQARKGKCDLFAWGREGGAPVSKDQSARVHGVGVKSREERG